MAAPNIILTGFMGTGKSTVGRLLAKQLDYRFIDTDTLIEERIGCTIAAYFRDCGEAAFRCRETELAYELSEQSGLVIATGGGFLLREENVALLQKSGTIICLTATPAEILSRVTQDKTVRPLLQVDDPLDHIARLLDARHAAYAPFPQVATGGKTPQRICAEVLDLAS